MNFNLLKSIFIILWLVAFQTAESQVVDVSSGWKMKKASEVVESGMVLSVDVVDQLGWINAEVPGTILGSLVNAGSYPDPFFGMNNDIIPDISEAGGDNYSYWIITKFIFKNPDQGKEVWLSFRGVNFATEIWFNGVKLNGQSEMLRSGNYKFNITKEIKEDGSNMIAVLIAPGSFSDAVSAERGSWINVAKDRNAGIWDKVQIEVTGIVDVRNSYVKARVPKEREPYNIQDPAFLDVTAELVNTSAEAIKGVAVVEIGGMKVKEKVELLPGTTQLVQFGDIKVKDPKLWWPNGVGPQPLYQIKVSFFGNKDFEYDREIITTGIRETGFRTDKETGLGIFTVNGKDIFIRGGNWSASDELLRLSAGRYEAELKLHAGMNMNMIRVRGGNMIERPDFYSSADKYGLLVWQEISAGLNENLTDEVTGSLVNQIKMIRNHPSLMMWGLPETAGLSNEMIVFFADTIIGKLDPQSLFYQKINNAGTKGVKLFDSSPAKDEPSELSEFFTSKLPHFNTGIGSEGLPEIGSLDMFVPDNEKIIPVDNNLTAFWKAHQWNRKSPLLDKYGELADFNDFVAKSQLLSYEYYKAIIEGYNTHMFKSYSGVLVERSQTSRPVLQGQLYDTYLGPNAGYFGFMAGSKPFHIQMDLSDTSVLVVNSSARAYSAITVEMTVFNAKGDIVFTENRDFDSKPNSVTTLMKPVIPGKGEELLFVRLRLINQRMSERLDENIYWLGTRSESNKPLFDLPQTMVEANLTHMSEGRMLVELVNTSNVIAFFVNIQFSRDDTHERIQPVLMDSNYITIFPGEKKRVVVDLSSVTNIKVNEYIEMKLEGFNTPPHSVVFQK